MIALLLDLLREDRAEMTEAEVAGTYSALLDLQMGQPNVALHAVEEGLVALAVEELCTGSPAEWISVARNPSGRFGQVFQLVQELCYTVPREHMHLVAATPRLLDVFLDVLGAYETVDPGDANIISIFCGAFGLFEIHEALFEFSQINQTAVRSASSQIRYVLDHPVGFSTTHGWTTNVAAVRRMLS